MTGIARRRVLVVEDEMMVALQLKDDLTDLGFDVVGPMTRFETALDAATTADVDLAVLDINLGGKTSFAVAEMLRARGVPFIFASGYGPAGLPENLATVTALQKPFTVERLERALDDLPGKPAAASP